MCCKKVCVVVVVLMLIRCLCCFCLNTAVLKLAQNERTRRLSVMHGAMDVLSALANSPSNDIVDKISKCLYLYCSDASNHSIVVKNVGDLITRLTDRTKRTTNLSLKAKCNYSGMKTKV